VCWDARDKGIRLQLIARYRVGPFDPRALRLWGWQKIGDLHVLELDLWFFLIAGPATIFAGISKGGFGSGAAFASASILALVVDPGLALGVMLPLLMLIDLALLRPYWRQWDWRLSRGLLLGGVPGVALGAWF